MRAGEGVATDGDDGVLVESEHLEIPQVPEVVVLRGYDAISGQAEGSKVPQQAQCLRGDLDEAVVAEIQSFETVLEAPKGKEVQSLDVVVSEEEALYLQAEEISVADASDLVSLEAEVLDGGRSDFCQGPRDGVQSRSGTVQTQRSVTLEAGAALR